MSWEFDETIGFAVAMAMHDISEEKRRRLAKTQKFYQECCEQIAALGKQASQTVTDVVTTASRRYIPGEISTGCRYLTLYAFFLVLRKQRSATKEQQKLMRMYFNSMRLPFRYGEFVEAACAGRDVGDFSSVIAIDRSFMGEFWLNFFRALYKCGSTEQLQTVINSVTSTIMRFSVLGEPDSGIAPQLCRQFVESVNAQLERARAVSPDEIDWLGVVPISERVGQILDSFEQLCDRSQVGESFDRSELMPMPQLLLLSCLQEMISLSGNSKQVQRLMLAEAAELCGLQTEITPERFFEEVSTVSTTGSSLKQLYGAGPPPGEFWGMINIMAAQADMPDNAVVIVNNILSILMQVENHLAVSYTLSGSSLAKDYMVTVLKQLV